MKYHARISYPGGNDDIALNLSREQLYHDIISPFYAGHVAVVPLSGGIQTINMRAAKRLALYETPNDVRIEDFYNPHDEIVKDCTARVLQGLPESILSQSSARSFLGLVFAPQKPQAFVIMKYGDKALDSAYTGVVKPVFKQFNLEAFRIDAGHITDQMLTSIAESTIIYADLSGERPNCYYETGFAHALGKNLILAINTKYERHFDIAGYRFIQWETEQELREQLTSRLKVIVGRK